MAKKYFIVLDNKLQLSIQQLYIKEYKQDCLSDRIYPLEVYFDTEEEAQELFETIKNNFWQSINNFVRSTAAEYSMFPVKIRGKSLLSKFSYTKRIEKGDKIIFLKGKNQGKIYSIPLNEKTKYENYHYFDYLNGLFDFYDDYKNKNQK